MPNRVIREGILTSDRVNEIAGNPATEVFYRRLFSVVDDYGRYSSSPALLRAALYPLRLDSIRESDLAQHVRACEAAGLIRTYSIEGKGYLELADFNQTVRIKRSKYPQPEQYDKQTLYTCIARDEHVRSICVPESESGSETESETNPPSPATPDEDDWLLQAEPQEKPPSLSQQQERWFADLFWPEYWRKVDRADALKAFKRHATTEAKMQQIVAAVRAHAPMYLKRDPEHRPHAATWLNKLRWQEEPEIQALTLVNKTINPALATAFSQCRDLHPNCTDPDAAERILSTLASSGKITAADAPLMEPGMRRWLDSAAWTKFAEDADALRYAKQDAPEVRVYRSFAAWISDCAWRAKPAPSAAAKAAQRASKVSSDGIDPNAEWVAPWKVQAAQ